MVKALVREIYITLRYGRNKGGRVPSGWSIWQEGDKRIHQWRSHNHRNVVEYVYDSDAGTVTRTQVKGYHTAYKVGVPRVWHSGESGFAEQLANLLGLDDGVVKNIGGRSGWRVIANNPTLRQKWAKYFA